MYYEDVNLILFACVNDRLLFWLRSIELILIRIDFIANWIQKSKENKKQKQKQDVGAIQSNVNIIHVINTFR